MSQYLLGQYLSELDAFLIEAVQIPQEALEHDLVLEVGEKSTECFRCQFIADDYA